MDGGQRLLERLRDRVDLRTGLVSIALAYFALELLALVIGPLPPAVVSLGTLGLALLLLTTIVPWLRRGGRRPPADGDDGSPAGPGGDADAPAPGESR